MYFDVGCTAAALAKAAGGTIGSSISGRGSGKHNDQCDKYEHWKRAKDYDSHKNANGKCAAEYEGGHHWKHPHTGHNH